MIIIIRRNSERGARQGMIVVVDSVTTKNEEGSDEVIMEAAKGIQRVM